MKKLNNMRSTMICLLFSGILGLSGCGLMQENESEARLVTQYATIKIIDGDQDRAVRVQEIAAEVREYASGEKALTIGILVDQIRSRVPWRKLDAADKLLVNALLDELRLRLEERFGADPLPEDLRLAVDTVADWVISAARLT